MEQNIAKSFEDPDDFDFSGVNIENLESDIDVFLAGFLRNLEPDNLSLTSTVNTSDEICSSDSNSYQSKRKRDDEELLEYDDHDTLSHGLELFRTLPERILTIFNGGNLNSIKEFTSKLMDHSIVFTLKTPKFTLEKHGKNVAVELFKALTQTHPDMVMSFEKSNVIQNSDSLHFIGSTRVRGTRLYPKYLNEFYGLKEDTLASEFLFDPEKTSPVEIEKQSCIERNAIASGQAVQVFMKVSVTLTYDLTSELIVKHQSRVRLSSLRLAPV